MEDDEDGEVVAQEALEPVGVLELSGDMQAGSSDQGRKALGMIGAEALDDQEGPPVCHAEGSTSTTKSDAPVTVPSAVSIFSTSSGFRSQLAAKSDGAVMTRRFPVPLNDSAQ